MVRRFVLVLVHAHDDGEVFALRRSGDDDLLGAAAGDVVLGALHGLALLVDAVLLDGKEAGRLDDDLDAQVAPGDAAGIGFLECLDLAAVDQQAIFLHFHGPIEAAVVAVVLEEMGHSLQIADIIECHDLKRVAMMIPDCLQYLSPDAAEAVDTNTNCHRDNLLLVKPVLTYLIRLRSVEFSLCQGHCGLVVAIEPLVQAAVLNRDRAEAGNCLGELALLRVEGMRLGRIHPQHADGLALYV